MYYYAGVVNIHGKIVPLLNFVTSEHNIAAINSYLMHFKHCFGQKWPIFRMVVIDFSMAILNAVCEPWNKLSLIDYINLCYKHCKSGETNTNCIVIMLCGSHFQQMISRCINSITKSKRVHDFVLDCTAFLIISTDFKTIRGIIRLMFIILLSMKKTIWCAESMNQLNGYCLSVKLKEISSSSNDVGENLVLSTNDHKNVREKSLFYVDFEKIYQNISDRCLLTDSCELLAVYEFHCKLFAKKFLNLYLPYVCMWTRLMMPLEIMSDFSVKNITNSNVEKHFDNVKNSLMKSETNMKLGRFVNIIQKYTEAVCIEIKEKIPKYAHRKRKKTQNTILFESFLIDHNYAQSIQKDNKRYKPTASEWSVDQTLCPGDKMNSSVEENWQKRSKIVESHLRHSNIERLSYQWQYKCSEGVTDTPNLDYPVFNERILELPQYSNHLFTDIKYYFQVVGKQFVVSVYLMKSIRVLNFMVMTFAGCRRVHG